MEGRLFRTLESTGVHPFLSVPGGCLEANPPFLDDIRVVRIPAIFGPTVPPQSPTCLPGPTLRAEKPVCALV